MAAGDPQLVEQLELPPQRFRVDLAEEQPAVLGRQAADVVGGFVEELEAEAARSCRQEAGGVFGAGLGAGIEDRVSTTGVGLERVFGAHTIAEAD